LTAEKVPARSSTSWVLQRVTGVLLALLLGGHIVILHIEDKSPFSLKEIAERLSEQYTFWWFYYVLFVVAAFFHALTGVWAIYLDYGPGPGARKTVLVLLWIVGIALSVYSIFTLRALTTTL
jgi:succinate dehydrogenase hydrophobic membrane anchor protein